MKNIKDVYDEAQMEKANKVDDLSGIKLESQQEFIEEHRELIRVMREGSREELILAAEEQEEELESFLSANNLPKSLMNDDDGEDNMNEDD